MKITNTTALLGEDIACEYLKKKGYKIIERNFRKGYTEIDIVAEKDDILVFIEVKSRKSTLYGTPFEGIAPWKVRNLVKTAQFYKLLYPKLPDDMRIDAIGVTLTLDDQILNIEHIENISGF